MSANPIRARAKTPALPQELLDELADEFQKIFERELRRHAKLAETHAKLREKRERERFPGVLSAEARLRIAKRRHERSQTTFHRKFWSATYDLACGNFERPLELLHRKKANLFARGVKLRDPALRRVAEFIARLEELSKET